MASYGERLKAAMRAEAVTIRELAMTLRREVGAPAERAGIGQGVSERSIQRYRADEARPTRDLSNAIARILDRSDHWLWSGDPPESRETFPTPAWEADTEQLSSTPLWRVGLAPDDSVDSMDRATFTSVVKATFPEYYADRSDARSLPDFLRIKFGWVLDKHIRRGMRLRAFERAEVACDLALGLMDPARDQARQWHQATQPYWTLEFQLWADRRLHELAREASTQGEAGLTCESRAVRTLTLGALRSGDCREGFERPT